MGHAPVCTENQILLLRERLRDGQRFLGVSNRNAEYRAGYRKTDDSRRHSNNQFPGAYSHYRLHPVCCDKGQAAAASRCDDHHENAFKPVAQNSKSQHLA